MKTKSQIYMEYDRAMIQAKELEQVANDIDGLARNDLENTINGISSAWRSDSASAYLNKAVDLQQDIRKSSKRIDNISESIRNAAKIIRDAELEALRIAQQNQQ